MTFRRSAAAPSSQSSQPAPDATVPTPAAPETAQPLQTPSLPTDRSLRYTRDQLLSLFHASNDAAAIDASNLFVSGWNPTQVNGAARGWGKASEGTIPQDPTVCWDASGGLKPVGSFEMTAEEKELFIDVNSTMKPPQQKDGGQGGGGGGLNGRKTSVSHGTNAYNVTSPLSASRPATRRRETSDTNPFPSSGNLASPIAARTPRDDSWFGRKGTDPRDLQQFEEPEEDPSLSAPKSAGLNMLARGNAGGVPSMWNASAGAAPGAAVASVGAFGNFALPSATGDKRFGSLRGESRLAHLLPKQDGPDLSAKPGGGGGGTGGAGGAGGTGGTGGPTTKDSWRTRPRTDTDPFSEDVGPMDPSGHQPFDTPLKSAGGGDFGMAGLNLASGLDDDGAAASPETNPFRSPPAERGDDDHHHLAATTSAALEKGMGMLSGGIPEPSSNFNSLRGYPSAAFDGSDRSQTSSVGAKGFPGLGNIAGWGNALNASTPDRERAVFSSAFGNSLFSPVTGELQSPGFGAGVPGMFGPSVSGTSSLRGTSKLGSLFPPSMQAQMAAVGQEQEGGLGDSMPDLRQSNPLGAIGREAIGGQGRDMDTLGSRSGRGGLFEELMEASRAGGGGMFPGSEQQAQPGMLTSTISAMGPAQAFETGGARPNVDTPPNPPRTMVMPDRMRWVYLDPQGQTQGPFTGLEMNDWYKANFFTADLRVKKVEDIEFEPLGQLIRRIGNSREPFLVPQMGVAHGQPSLSGTFAHGDRGTVIPPLVGAFPSYGRTLTAEEQNNLERRKQEEQYMLARQREMLAVQHHPFAGTRVPPTAAGALHHHSSVHSLQSQPSFGSMTSPLGAGPPAMPGALGVSQAFFDHTGMPMPTALPPVSSGADLLRDDQMLSGLQAGVGATAPGFYPGPPAAPLASDVVGRPNLPSLDQLQKDPQGFSERLKEFHQLRENVHVEETAGAGLSFVAAETIEEAQHAAPLQAQEAAAAVGVAADEAAVAEAAKLTSGDGTASPPDTLSLTQQVQKAQAAAAKRNAVQEQEEEKVATIPEAEAHTDLPMPFPPPQGATPTIAAPTAQRTRSTLPDQYATSRSQSETPENAAAQAPPLAPWARDLATESHHKGPSLKEIQEAEAKKAAKAEEAAATVRKALAEQEAALQREREKAAAAAAPGLPTSSTWATNAPSGSASSSPWSKPGGMASNKPNSLGATGGSGNNNNNGHGASEKKKTLADIQREEEARKQKSRELAVQSGLLAQSLAGSGSSGGSSGKRYADLASKVQGSSNASSPVIGSSGSPVGGAASSSSVGSGWATVGAGGKVKAPAMSSVGSVSGRTVSGASVAGSPSVAVKATPVAVPAVRTASKQGAAMEEFNKWVHRELSRGITSGIDLAGFVDSLQHLPLDLTIISEAVYASSKTMDGRHFAEEFIRRKKLAEKGVVDRQATVAAPSENKSSGGGWSEVAKKGGSSHAKEESVPAGFKVVPSRKKGKK